ncbi:MAG TPA: hypothetical protein VGR06_37805 [Actinophytocola sp.]|jgi:hypothetical protein|uniref:hypothetical protein n=1 Tax=Actinophytocola sp. TaxID=1872138 RepID=UPI002DFEAA4C|nr:hypothetical protein [Actinophytocola sp.]
MGIKLFLAAVVIGATVLSTPATAAGADASPPSGPNPYLSFLPDQSHVDYAAWRTYLARQSGARLTAAAPEGPVVHENEPPGVLGRNDTRATAERVPGFGSGRRQTVRIVGQLASSESTVDVDVYRVELRAGDVFAATVQGEAHRLTIFDPAGVEVQGSAQDFSVLYPPSSPLPHSGNAIADHVASVSGTHYLAVSEGSGAYQLDVQAHRPPLERELRPQTVFLDFDGASVDMGIFGIDPSPGVRALSPFSTFLPRWGLTPADEPALVRQIMRTVRENLIEDVQRRSKNPTARLILLNSLEHPDTFGRENVSRVVVGGTADEAGFVTVGISQSIDPGNFAQEETALVLLDLVSQPAGPAVSLNTYLAPQSNRIEFIGRALGNVISHEIGHYLGSWHTDPANALVSLMDDGGTNIPGFFGVGPDGIGGTADDTDNDLTSDTYRPSEGFTGTEDTLNRTAFGLS